MALKRAGLEPADLDLVEINEAFAAVALWSARMLDLDPAKVNARGGAVALGHPIGATGARLIVTLIHALRQARWRDRRRDVVRRWRPGRRPDHPGRLMAEIPERNLGLDLVRVTETAAMAAARWQGRGDKDAVDRAAVDAMRAHLATLDIDGIVVIGEGEKDNAPMLYNGERVGSGSGPEVDVAVDPVDGTRLTAEGGPGALAVLVVSERGTMYAPGKLVYMDKIAVGPEAAGTIALDAPVDYNLRQVAKARGKDVNDLQAIILDRPRNQRYIDAVREAGARHPADP